MLTDADSLHIFLLVFTCWVGACSGLCAIDWADGFVHCCVQASGQGLMSSFETCGMMRRASQGRWTVGLPVQPSCSDKATSVSAWLISAKHVADEGGLAVSSQMTIKTKSSQLIKETQEEEGKSLVTLPSQ